MKFKNPRRKSLILLVLNLILLISITIMTFAASSIYLEEFSTADEMAGWIFMAGLFMLVTILSNLVKLVVLAVIKKFSWLRFLLAAILVFDLIFLQNLVILALQISTPVYELPDAISSILIYGLFTFHILSYLGIFILTTFSELSYLWTKFNNLISREK